MDLLDQKLQENVGIVESKSISPANCYFLGKSWYCFSW